MKREGLPPWEALEKFSDPELWERFFELRDEERTLALREENGWPLTNLGDRTSRYLDARDKLLDSFFEKLISGDLVASGYHASLATRGTAGPVSHDAPIRARQIPHDLWRSLDLDLDQSSASGTGIEFAALRIRPAGRFSAWLMLQCRSWMEREVSRGYCPRTREEMWLKVQGKYGNEISRFAFDSVVWPQVASPEWRKGGRKPRRFES